MNTICKEVLTDDLTLELVKYDESTWMVRYYINCEDRHTEYGNYTDLQEAIDAFDLECRRQRIKSAISSVVASRKNRGGANDDLRVYLDHVSGIWGHDSDISLHIEDIRRFEL